VCPAPERQNELTRRIQEKLAEAAALPKFVAGAPEVLPILSNTTTVTTIIQ
jgi:hypothetical protein